MVQAMRRFTSPALCWKARILAMTAFGAVASAGGTGLGWLDVPEVAAQSPSVADSAAVHEAARRALKEHRERVLEFPVMPNSPVRIPTNYAPTQMEHNAARAATSRPRLIAALDSLGTLLPGDYFIIANRVGYRFLDGDLDGALRTARECEATGWWCGALEGFVLHQMARFEEAESAFDDALANMPLDLRCQWQEDMRAFMDRDLSVAFSHMSCLDRMKLETRIWRLADPFYLMPGNDRRTEHFARMVAWEMRDMQDFIDAGYRFPISRDTSPARHANRTALGWPQWWWDFWGPPTPVGDLPGYRTTPSGEILQNPIGSDRADWSLVLRTDDVIRYGHTRRASSAGCARVLDELSLRDIEWGDRYLPSYAIYRDLSDQTAFFARGDSFAVAAATDLSGHPLAIRRPLEVGMVLMREELDEAAIVWGEEVSLARYLFRTKVPAEAHFVSIEALAGREAAARVRFGHGLPGIEEGALGLSDLLLFEWREGIPEQLDAVAPHMLGSTRITGDEAIGLFWEVYGLRESNGIDVSLTVRREDAGILRRLGQALRLVAARDGPSVRWEEEGGIDEIAGRTLRLDLSGLDPGDYVLEIEVRTPDGHEAGASRSFVRAGN